VSFAADAASWSVVVLTGGASGRMGSDKATLVVGGATLLERTLSGVPEDIPVVVAGPEVSLPDVVGRRRVRFAVEDPPRGGPVAGLDAALAHVSTAVVVVLATDLPFVGRAPGALVARLLTGEGVDAVLAVDAAGRAQQLCAAYRLEALREAIAAGGSPAGAAMRDVVKRLRVEVAEVSAASDDGSVAAMGDPTWDVDTPDDVARMTALLRNDDPESQSE
jgi:molybdopterin-guanine dinucleotide biosynthesis protein A